MGKIINNIERDEQTIINLLNIWETVVKKTHTFLSDHNIAEIKPEVYKILKTIDILCCYADDNGVLQGFIGIENQKIEALFIAEHVRRQGIGKILLDNAVNQYQISLVDVNEQNKQGLGFYQHMGFQNPCSKKFLIESNGV
ncbi:GNAT family N-acetyltransferase [Stenoxybacter acetivorans]|uniref:GNAT family N-acetyltransferase n=1 Tax=Stenoxybacter acetivorans TaxID=422441 RepID=UPI0006895514|nr:GNAT family N-acetyltransferase [Stenoxybacter acetivorans]